MNVNSVFLTNSLSKKKEEFKAIKEGYIGMYSCGPTVWDYVHIGNLRSFLLSDIVRRVFEYNNFKVHQVINITDVGIGGDNDEGEDKIVRGLKREGKQVTLEAMQELTDFYTKKFKEDISLLNMLMPHVMPRAAQHISEDIVLIQTLEKKGVAYATADGIYFDTSKDPQYGALGGVAREKEDEAQARVKTNNQKRNFRDFAVWKLNPAIGYESPWGKGFPGWHIECSAMSEKYLGEHFDIHTGGIDLAPIHHNNEIAQSECAHDQMFVNYWLHNAHVNVESGKMAKSAGTGITLRSVIERGINPLAYRYWVLGGHYRTPMTFSFEALKAAGQAYKRLLGFMYEWKDEKAANGAEKYEQAFLEAINDDLNTPQALAVVWEMIGDQNISSADRKASLLKFDAVLGLKLDEKNDVIVPEEVKKLAKERELARKERRWNDADDLRKKIQESGFEVKDMDKGSLIEKI